MHDAMLYMLTQSVPGVSVLESSHGSPPNAYRVCACVGRNVDIEILESAQQESDALVPDSVSDADSCRQDSPQARSHDRIGEQ